MKWSARATCDLVTFWKDRWTSGKTDDKQERLRPFGGSRDEARVER